MQHTSIQILNRDQLDSDRWNALITQYGDPFLYSWYLDLVWPSWKALIAGDYQAGVPVFEKNTMLGSFIGHPSFVEAISASGDQEEASRLLEVYRERLGRSPHVFSLLDSSEENSNRKYQRWKKNEVKNYPGKVLRRNLRKAESAGFSEIYDMEVPEFIILLKLNLKDKDAGYKEKHYALLQSIIEKSVKLGVGFIKGIKSQSGWHCGQFYLQSQGRCYLVTCFSDSFSRENSGLHFLLHSIFMSLPDHGEVHFGGSNVPAIAEFNKNFGAEDYYYQRIERSYLPGPFKKLLSWL